MKTQILLLLTCLLPFTGVRSQSTDTLVPYLFGDEDSKRIKAIDGYLNASFGYTIAANVLFLAGGTTFATGADGELGPAGAIGFFVGFSGMEMLKFSTIPIVKARRNLEALRYTFPDTTSYQNIFKNVKIAETLSHVAVAGIFLGQTLTILGLFQQDDTKYLVLVASGITMGAIGIGSSLATTYFTKRASIQLGESMGAIGFGIGQDGIGVRYSIVYGKSK